ncbi:histidine kinase [Flavihumibacter rivuli]|uniref:sensor histidine kinase n=1 Tax=Flavihumibacter rivuli TaxID=2838156 RepID=UPI001BDE92E3|nr:histidine kinase [Flavihumibacter rivuli]ULQ58233.1 histidine kinase [Flavihumibacter rivuli]
MLATIYLVYYSILFFDRQFPPGQTALKRYVTELLFVVIAGFGINKLFHSLFIAWVVVPEPDMEFLDRKLRILLVVSQTLVVFTYGIFTAFRIFTIHRQKQLEVVQWQKEIAESQYEALKNQLNPHFLFNSLSILSSLVHYDAGKAEIFIEKLSRTYRYLLDQREKTAVSLEEEIQFLRNFMYIVQERYGKKIDITNALKGESGNAYIIPNTFLIILEHIIATSSMSAASPLHILLNLTGEKILVIYSLQKKTNSVPAADDQFDLLCNRYRDLGKPINISVIEMEQKEIISIPLLIK